MDKPRKIRVAIYGGDDRVGNLEWPSYLDVRTFPYKSPNAIRRLQASMSSGSLDHVVVLTSYMSHGADDAIKNASGSTNVIKFPRSPMQLSRDIHTIIKPPAVNPLLVPGKQLPPAPQQIADRIASVTSALAHETKVVSYAQPPVDEPFGDALRRLLASSGTKQMELAEMLGVHSSTVSGWTHGASMPSSSIAPKLIAIWPDLARYEYVAVGQKRGAAKVPGRSPQREPAPTQEVQPTTVRQLMDKTRAAASAAGVDTGFLQVHDPESMAAVDAARDKILDRALEEWRAARAALDAAKERFARAEMDLLSLAEKRSPLKDV